MSIAPLADSWNSSTRPNRLLSCLLVRDRICILKSNHPYSFCACRKARSRSAASCRFARAAHVLLGLVRPSRPFLSRRRPLKFELLPGLRGNAWCWIRPIFHFAVPYAELHAMHQPAVTAALVARYFPPFPHFNPCRSDVHRSPHNLVRAACA